MGTKYAREASIILMLKLWNKGNLICYLAWPFWLLKVPISIIHSEVLSSRLTLRIRTAGASCKTSWNLKLVYLSIGKQKARRRGKEKAWNPRKEWKRGSQESTREARRRGEEKKWRNRKSRGENISNRFKILSVSFLTLVYQVL